MYGFDKAVNTAALVVLVLPADYRRIIEEITFTNYRGIDTLLMTHR